MPVDTTTCHALNFIRSGQKTTTITIKPGQTAHLNADLVAANQEPTRL
jgi:hypothetical protein